MLSLGGMLACEYVRECPEAIGVKGAIDTLPSAPHLRLEYGACMPCIILL